MSNNESSGWDCPGCYKGILGVIHSAMIMVDMADEKTGDIREEPARRRYRECSKCGQRYVTLETISHKVNKKK